MPGFFLYEDYVLKSLVERLETIGTTSPNYKEKFNELSNECKDYIGSTKELLLECSKRLYHLDLYLHNEISKNDLERNMNDEWIDFIRLSNINKDN